MGVCGIFLLKAMGSPVLSQFDLYPGPNTCYHNYVGNCSVLGVY